MMIKGYREGKRMIERNWIRTVHVEVLLWMSPLEMNLNFTVPDMLQINLIRVKWIVSKQLQVIIIIIIIIIIRGGGNNFISFSGFIMFFFCYYIKWWFLISERDKSLIPLPSSFFLPYSSYRSFFITHLFLY